MVCNMKKVIVFLVLLLSFQQIWGRPLKLREGKLFRKSLVIQSLQRGPVQGSGSNPCSTVPGRSHGRCNAEVNVVARHVASSAPPPPPSPPFPNMVDKFGAAASINASKTQNQGSSPP